jgi:glutathione S-transferase
MALKLYFHPLASFCHKALIALYENRIPFEPIIVDLRDEASSAAFRAVWPMAKMPVLRDEARYRTVAESTIIIEFLDAHYPGPTRFLPADVDRAWQTRMWDRFYDHYIQNPCRRSWPTGCVPRARPMRTGWSLQRRSSRRPTA